MWSDVFQEERGWGDFDDNDYVKDDKDKPRQGQGKQLGGWLISNMTKRMTTRPQRGLRPGKCDGSVGEDELQKGHRQNLWGWLRTVGYWNMHCPMVKCRRTKNSSHNLTPNLI